MKLSIVSWNGTTDINNNTTFTSWYEGKQQLVPVRQGVYVERPEKWPKLSGATFEEHTFVFKIRCLGTIHSQRETVKGWFSMEDFTPHNLVMEDTADSNRQWYITGMPIRIVEETPGVMAVTLATDEPFLRTVVDSTGAMTISSSSSSTDFTVVGNLIARPVFTITPTLAKTGDFAYSRWIPIYNPSGQKFIGYPFDFSCGSLDTAALISGSKIKQSDGTDLILEIDGQTVDRWFGTTDGRGINTTDTAVWGNIDIAKTPTFTLRDALTDVGTTIYLQMQTDKAQDLQSALGMLNRVVLIDNEAITYTTLTVTGTAWYLTVRDRGAKGTIPAAHSAAATIRFLERDCWLVYGSSDYSTSSTDYYTVDNKYKPMFDLHSTNTSWIYTSFNERNKPRPGGWYPATVRAGTGGRCKSYRGDHVSDTDPASDAGMYIASYNNGATWQPDSGRITWGLNDPGGITNIQVAGEKYLYSYSGTLWPATAGIEYLHPLTNIWNLIGNQSIPSTSGAWEAFTIASTADGDIGTTVYSLRAVFSGGVAGIANNYAALEMDSITLTKNSATIPQATLGAEQSQYKLFATITNETSGESINIRTITPLNKRVTIDCDAETAELQDGTNVRAGVYFSTPRSDWLNMRSGANTITYFERGAAGVTFGIEWENRNTL